MKMEKVEFKDIANMGLTYSHEEIRNFIFRGRESLSYEEIAQLNLPKKRIVDKGWILFHLLGYRHPQCAMRLARRIALDVAHLRQPNDEANTSALLAAKAAGIVAMVDNTVGPEAIDPGIATRRASGAALVNVASAALAASGDSNGKYISWALDTLCSMSTGKPVLM
jgi:hypothetical protein